MPNLGVSGTTQYQALVQEATRRLAETSPPLDVGDVADAAGVPRAVAANLFPSGAALSTAVGQNATVRLADYLQRCATQEGVDDAVAQYRAVCVGYLEWVIANPEAFQILNTRGIFLQSRNGEIGRYNRAMRELMTALLQRAGDRGRLRDGVDIHETTLMTRAYMHGIATLVIHRLARHWTDGEDMLDAARQNVNHYLDGLFLAERAAQPIRSEA